MKSSAQSDVARELHQSRLQPWSWDDRFVIPSKVEEWSERDERHGRLCRDGSGERVGRRTSSISYCSSRGVSTSLDMTMRFFNTYSRQIEQFEPRNPAERAIGVYTCGPTVYSRAHIGNFRAYIFEDLLQRHLELYGFKVHRVMNITDVDDKTIRGAREAKISLNDFTDPFKRAFFDDVDTLRIKRADKYPGATEPRYLARMIEMIAELIKRDLAYQAEDKSVYFRINKFPDYGKLAHLNLEELRPTGRVRNDE